MPAGFSDRERSAIRARLLDAARDALARGGLGAASVESLAREAGIAKGSFYSFYPGKEHLFLEALESVEDEYRRRFAAAVDGAGAPAERLERAFAEAFDMAASEPTLRRLDAETVGRLARALPPERVEEHQARDSEAIARIADGWRRQGLLAEGARDAEVAAAGYAVFLVEAGLGFLPPELADAVRSVSARGFARALAAGDGRGVDDGGRSSAGGRG